MIIQNTMMSQLSKLLKAKNNSVSQMIEAKVVFSTLWIHFYIHVYKYMNILWILTMNSL